MDCSIEFDCDESLTPPADEGGVLWSSFNPEITFCSCLMRWVCESSGKSSTKDGFVVTVGMLEELPLSVKVVSKLRLLLLRLVWPPLLTLSAPELLDGLELIGEMESAGLCKPPAFFGRDGTANDIEKLQVR